MFPAGTNSPSPHDAFAVLGLPRRFGLCPGDVQRAYLNKVMQAHPDAVGAEMLDDLDDASSLAANLNRAKATLESDEARANLLLALLGGPGKEADKSLPDGFLMEIMEIREQVDDALASKGPSQATERAKWKQWALAQRTEYAKTASEMFQRLESAVDPVASVVARDLRRHLNAWRYIERMLEQLDESYDPAKADWRASEPSEEIR
jgi:hypothetical protein